MFGLFKSRPAVPEPAVTPEDKQWVEESILWLIKVFGLQHLRPQSFILPEQIGALKTDLRDQKNLQTLLEELCEYWDINPDTVIVKLFDDVLSKQWTEITPHVEGKLESGLYYEGYTAEKERFNVDLAASILDNPTYTACVMAHELGHVKLLGGNYIRHDQADLEPLTDLCMIFFGFGQIAANMSVAEVNNWLRGNGYLPANVIAYANAVLCYVLKYDGNDYVKIFNRNTRELFDKSYYFLKQTEDTILNADVVAKAERQYELGAAIDKAFRESRYVDAEHLIRELKNLCPEELSYLNNLGYALLQQRKYEEAIAAFTDAIEKDPYYDYPFNNRGYCRLQTGDLENGRIDIKCAYEMNPDNAYASRNLGVYFLLKGDDRKALEYFEHAEKVDPNTEMINFYLSQAHKNLGDMEKAKEYALVSEQLKEHNDSVLEPVIQSTTV